MIKGHDRKALFELTQSTIGSFNLKNLEKWLLNLQWFLGPQKRARGQF